MVLTFSASTRLITEVAEPGNPGVVFYDAFSDLFVPLADWYTGDRLSAFFPLRAVGGQFLYSDNLGNPVYGPTVFFLQNQSGQNWRIRPANYDHEIRFISGTFLPEDSTAPLFDLTGITANIVFRPDLALAQAGYFIESGGSSGGGFTTSDRAKLDALFGLLDGSALAATAFANQPQDFTESDREALFNLLRGLGRIPGVSASQKDPVPATENSPAIDGWLTTSDGKIAQSITLNADGSVTISTNN